MNHLKIVDENKSALTKYFTFFDRLNPRKPPETNEISSSQYAIKLSQKPKPQEFMKT